MIMDPNATLAELRQLIADVNRQVDTGRDVDNYTAGELAGLADAIDGWLTRGGFLPADWKA